MMEVGRRYAFGLDVCGQSARGYWEKLPSGEVTRVYTEFLTRLTEPGEGVETFASEEEAKAHAWGDYIPRADR